MELLCIMFLYNVFQIEKLFYYKKYYSFEKLLNENL